MIIIDTYPGVDLAALTAAAHRHLPGYRVVDVEAAAARPIEEIDALLARNLTDDRVFGVLSHHRLTSCTTRTGWPRHAARIRDVPAPTVVLGWGAAQLLLDHAAGAAGAGRPRDPPSTAVVVLADLPRWELQQRYRRGMPNWRCDNGEQDVLRKFKRGFFVEWRIADRHKRRLFPIMDFLLDTTRTVDDAHLVTAEAFRAGLERATAGPFRLVPFFDPGPWGGTWMAEVVDLERGRQQLRLVLRLRAGGEQPAARRRTARVVEIPAMDLVLSRPRELLGPLTFARFGAEFPIRFDFLDTMGGGNLSLQVHPLTDYITDTFGMTYTQDESYYLLDAGDDAASTSDCATTPTWTRCSATCTAAQDGRHPFDAEKYVNRLPGRASTTTS